MILIYFEKTDYHVHDSVDFLYRDHSRELAFGDGHNSWVKARLDQIHAAFVLYIGLAHGTDLAHDIVSVGEVGGDIEYLCDGVHLDKTVESSRGVRNCGYFDRR